MRTVGSHLGRIANRSEVPDKGGGHGRQHTCVSYGARQANGHFSLGEGCRLEDIYIYIYIYIYYYTPLPLNLANKQQASNNKQATTSKQQQALLLTVLAIAPPHRSGLYSTLAILEPRWWPCQIQVLSQKLTGGGPGRGRQVGRCPPKSAQFWAKNSHFSPKTALVRAQNSQTKANGCYTPRAACLSGDQGTFGAL